jgi:hypothetical protein
MNVGGHCSLSHKSVTDTRRRDGTYTKFPHDQSKSADCPLPNDGNQQTCRAIAAEPALRRTRRYLPATTFTGLVRPQHQIRANKNHCNAKVKLLLQIRW